ncbi:MAG: nitrous oxide reductase family maturation protein NosD [Nitrososphaerales archaeon]
MKKLGRATITSIVMLSLIIAGLPLVSLVPPASAQVPGCGSVITTSMALTASIGPCSGNGLIIGANGIVLDCAGATISGLSAPNASAIVLTGRTGVTVENCIISAPISYHWQAPGFGHGFLLTGSSHNTLSGNTVQRFWGGGTPNGFTLSSSSDDNLLTGDSGGSFIINGSSNGNRLIGNVGERLYIDGSIGNVLTNNTAYSFYLGDSGGNVLTNNTANLGGNYDFYLYMSDGNVLTDNTARSSAYSGFYLNGSSRNTLTMNAVNNEGAFGFSIQASSNENILAGNTERSDVWGFFIWSSSGNTITTNMVNGNQYGFYLASAYNNTLLANRANTNSYDGFYLDGNSSKNTLTGDVAENNTQFGYVDYSSGSGTAGTASQYSRDACRGNGIDGSSPAGLCAALAVTSTSVSCTPSSVFVSMSTKCTATVTESSSPTGTVTFTSSSTTGTFSPANGQCALSSWSCSVNYTDTTAGSPTITASYGGDSNNTLSSGNTMVTVAEKPTTISVSNVYFESDSSFLTPPNGPAWVNLNDPFSSVTDAATYVQNVVSSGEVTTSDELTGLGSVSFYVDVANQGSVTAMNVKITVAANYELSYFACVIGTGVCTTSNGIGLGPVQVLDSQTFQVGDVPPGTATYGPYEFKLRYASVVAFGASVFGDVLSSNVVVGIPVTGSLTGFPSATQEAVFASASNAPLVHYDVPYSIGGLNTAEVGGSIISQACGVFDDVPVASAACDFLSQYTSSVGKGTSITSVAGEVAQDQVQSYATSIGEQDAAAIITIQYPDSVISLSATSPLGQVYQAQDTGTGLAQLTLNNPSPGHWTVRVSGTNITSGSADFNLTTVLAKVNPVAISCKPSSVVVGKTAMCKVVAYGSGSSSPTGIVAWSDNSSGKFSGSSCKLSKHKAYSTCSVRFTPTAAGSALLTANYLGDSSNSAATGENNMAVSPKGTTTIVSCSPKSVVAGTSKNITCKARVTGYSPTGTMSWSQIGTGSVSLASTSCTLSSLKNHNQATCSVTMTGVTAGTVILQGTYNGDQNNKGSFRAVTLTINKP